MGVLYTPLRAMETSRQHQSQRKTLLKVFKLAITPKYLELARQGLISIHCEIIGDSKGGVHMRTFRIHFEEQLTAEYNTSGNSFHVLEVRICSQKWSGVLCNSIRRIRRRWLKKGLGWKQYIHQGYAAHWSDELAFGRRCAKANHALSSAI